MKLFSNQQNHGDLKIMINRARKSLEDGHHQIGENM